MFQFGMLFYAYSKEGRGMNYQARISDQNNSRPDATARFVDSQGRTWEVSAEFKAVNGRPDIAALTIEATERGTFITRRLLHELPLEDLFGEALTQVARDIEGMTRNRRRSTSHQGRAHLDSELQAVADIYRAAYMARQPVQQAVAKALGVPVSTAAKRIMAARRRGFLNTPEDDD